MLSAKDQLSISDWLYTHDGKEIYYLEQKWGPDRKNLLATELHKVDPATKEDTTIGNVDRPSERSHSHMFSVAGDNTVRFYSTLADGIYETKLDRATEKITTAKIVDKALIGDGQLVQSTLSPDGTKLLVESGLSGTTQFTVSVVDIKAGTVKKLLQAPDTKIAYGNAQWAPKSDRVLVHTYPFGGDAQKQVGFKNQIILVDVDDASTAVIAEDLSPGIAASDYTKHLMVSYGWSPDGNYVVYASSNNLVFYDLAQDKVGHQLSVFTDYFAFDSGAGYGWANY